jgi:hypothetical protein
MPTILRAALISTHHCSFFFIRRFRVLIASVGVLPSGCAVLCYMVGAQLFLQPHLATSYFTDNTNPNYKSCFFGFIAYLNLYRNRGNQGAIHSPNHWHTGYYTDLLARNWVLQSERCYRSLCSNVAMSGFCFQLDTLCKIDISNQKGFLLLY